MGDRLKICPWVVSRVVPHRTTSAPRINVDFSGHVPIRAGVVMSPPNEMGGACQSNEN